MLVRAKGGGSGPELLARRASRGPLIFLGVLFFWFTGDHSLNSIWLSKWGVVFLACGISLTWWTWKISRGLAPLVFTVFLSAWGPLFWAPRLDGYPLELRLALMESVGGATLLFVLLLVVVSRLKAEALESLEIGFAYLGGIASLMVLLVADDYDVTQWVPLFDNPSLCGSFIAVTMALSFRLDGPWRMILCGMGLAALAYMRATVPFLASGAALCAYALSGGFRGVRWTPWGLFAAAGVAPWFLILAPKEGWFSDSGRFSMWGKALDAWRSGDLWTRLLGWGPGTTRVWNPLIQVANGKAIDQGVWHLWIHNDWLQLLLELGIVGAIAVLVASAAWCLRARKDPVILSAGAAYAVVMTFNFPWRWPVHAVLGAVLVARAFRR